MIREGQIQSAKESLGPLASQVIFLLAPLGTYRAQARLSEDDITFLETRAEQLETDLGRPADEIFQEELAFWEEDLRSTSTEYEDPETGEAQSGLHDLAAAGWQIAALEAGQNKTARQLQRANYRPTGRGVRLGIVTLVCHARLRDASGWIALGVAEPRRADTVRRRGKGGE